MKIKSLYVVKYKKIQDKFFYFRKMNSIIGPNNSGKTTLLEILQSFLKQDTTIFIDYKKDQKANNFNTKVEMKIIFNKTINKIPYDFSFYLNCKAEPVWELVRIKNLINNEKIRDKKIETWAFENKINLKKLIIPNDTKILSSHTTYKEIEEFIKQAIFYDLSKNMKQEILKINQFVSECNTETINLEKTKFVIDIASHETNYDLKPSFNLYQALEFNFDIKNPNSIANKGLGEQKEFVLKQYLNSGILIIDEIENSLSIKVLSQIVNLLQVKKEKVQIFYTTHNGYSLVFEPDKEIEIISLGKSDRISSEIFCEIKNLVFCEGISDVRVFKNNFSNYSFIQANGSNIVNSVKDIIKNTRSIPKVIVDGDSAGNSYYEKFLKDDGDENIYLNKKDIHILSKATIEDFVENKENILINFLSDNEIVKKYFDEEIIELFKIKILKEKELGKNQILNYIKNLLNEMFLSSKLVSQKNAKKIKKYLYSKLKIVLQKNISEKLVHQELKDFLN